MTGGNDSGNDGILASNVEQRQQPADVPQASEGQPVSDLTWHQDAPQQKPTVGEGGAWSTTGQDWYDAATGAGSRAAADDGSKHGNIHQEVNGYLRGDGNDTYRNTQTGLDWRFGGPAITRRDGDVVGTDVRVSGRDADGNILYNGRADYNNSGANAFKSAATPINAARNTWNNSSAMVSDPSLKNLFNLSMGLASDITALQGVGKEFMAFVECVTSPNFDPVQWLAGTLIDFLIQVFQPLEDLVGLVSGNETRMKQSASMWDTVANGCPEVGDFICGLGECTMSAWQGEAGDAARAKINDAGQAVGLMGFLAIGLKEVLGAMADMAKALRQDIVDLLAKGVSWALTRLLPQVAASIATFGATVATAIADAIYKVAQLLSKAFKRIKQAIEFFEKASKIFKFVMEVLRSIQSWLGPLIAWTAKNKSSINLGVRLGEQAITTFR